MTESNKDCRRQEEYRRLTVHRKLSCEGHWWTDRWPLGHGQQLSAENENTLSLDAYSASVQMWFGKWMNRSWCKTFFCIRFTKGLLRLLSVLFSTITERTIWSLNWQETIGHFCSEWRSKGLSFSSYSTDTNLTWDMRHKPELCWWCTWRSQTPPRTASNHASGLRPSCCRWWPWPAECALSASCCLSTSGHSLTAPLKPTAAQPAGRVHPTAGSKGHCPLPAWRPSRWACREQGQCCWGRLLLVGSWTWSLLPALGHLRSVSARLCPPPEQTSQHHTSELPLVGRIKCY